MRAKQLLVAAVAAAVLLQVMCTPTAEASVARKLLQVRRCWRRCSMQTYLTSRT